VTVILRVIASIIKTYRKRAK
jgi:hypothetical protein